MIQKYYLSTYGLIQSCMHIYSYPPRQIDPHIPPAFLEVIHVHLTVTKYVKFDMWLFKKSNFAAPFITSTKAIWPKCLECEIWLCGLRRKTQET